MDRRVYNTRKAKQRNQITGHNYKVASYFHQNKQEFKQVIFQGAEEIEMIEHILVTPPPPDENEIERKEEEEDEPEYYLSLSSDNVWCNFESWVQSNTYDDVCRDIAKYDGYAQHCWESIRNYFIEVGVLEWNNDDQDELYLYLQNWEDWEIGDINEFITYYKLPLKYRYDQ